MDGSETANPRKYTGRYKSHMAKPEAESSTLRKAEQNRKTEMVSGKSGVTEKGINEA